MKLLTAYRIPLTSNTLQVWMLREEQALVRQAEAAILQKSVNCIHDIKEGIPIDLHLGRASFFLKSQSDFLLDF